VSEYDCRIDLKKQLNSYGWGGGGGVDIFDLPKFGDGRKPIAKKVTNTFPFEGFCEKIHVCFDLDVTKG
jgi:hypothetical protein